MYFRILVF